MGVIGLNLPYTTNHHQQDGLDAVDNDHCFHQTPQLQKRTERCFTAEGLTGLVPCLALAKGPAEPRCSCIID